MPEVIERSYSDQFKIDIDTVLFKKQYFIEKVFPSFTEGRDYFLVDNKKTLGKSGAEKIAGAYGAVAVFEKDDNTMDAFKVEGLIAYRCNLLNKEGGIVAQGRGSAVLKDHEENVNTTIKVCQKRAFVDAVLRFSNLSDMFYQDLEDLNIINDFETSPQVTSLYSGDKIKNGDKMITEKQKEFLEKLIYKRIRSWNEQEKWLAELPTCTRFDASEMISSFLLAPTK